MSGMIPAMLAGASLGLSIAAPIGPTSMLCVQRTLAGGLGAGLATGLGVATVHLSYGTLVAQWGTGFASAWANAAMLSLVSGAVLLALAVRVLRSVLVVGDGPGQRRNLAATYCSAVGLALMNPITPVLFMAAIPTFLLHVTALFPGLVAGVFLGSLGWWVVLNGAVSVFRDRVDRRCLNLLNKVAGLLMALLAVRMMARGLAGYLNP